MLSKKENFEQWFVGLTEGDGSFIIVYTNGYWRFKYKLSLFKPNIQLLYFIKKQLNAGSIVKDGQSNFNMMKYHIQSHRTLKEVIFPLFDNHTFLTSKQFQYDRFKKCFDISENSNLSKEEKDKQIRELLILKCPRNYKASIWNQFKLNNNHSDYHSTINESFFLEKLQNLDIHRIITKPWLYGFIEAEGSFYISRKTETRLCHAFGVSQKNDPHLLEALRSLFGIKAKLQYYKKKDYYTISTTNSRSIETIINYFIGPNNTGSYMKGIKSLEFRIWTRSFYKYKGNYEKLLKIQTFMRKIRTQEYKLKE